MIRNALHSLATWVMQQTQTETAPAVQATSSLPVQMAPPSLYPVVSSYFATIPVPDRQRLMLFLYDSNFYVEHLINRIINPILGKTGYTLGFEQKDTATEDVLMAFWEINQLEELSVQEALLRDFLVVGEVCELIAPLEDTFLLAPVLPEALTQTIQDPQNYHKTVGVKQQTGMMEYVYHRVICKDERTLTQAAKRLRKTWKHECFLWQNLKKTAPIAAPGFDDLERLQKRGEPFLFTSADLFKHLIDYLWTSIDRVQALNTFNWGFKIKAQGTQTEKEAMVDRWKTRIGTPSPNSAFFYTDDLEVQPFAFPSGVATAIEGLFKLMRDTAGWTAVARNEDMGDSDVKYASMRDTGITNPTLETLTTLQTKGMNYIRTRCNYVLRQAWEQGRLPNEEVEVIRGTPRFSYEVYSPELSKRDFGHATTAFKTFEEAWTPIIQRGQYTPESVIAGEKQMVQELFGFDLEPLEEKEAGQPEQGGPIEEVLLEE